MSDVIEVDLGSVLDGLDLVALVDGDLDLLDLLGGEELCRDFAPVSFLHGVMPGLLGADGQLFNNRVDAAGTSLALGSVTDGGILSLAFRVSHGSSALDEALRSSLVMILTLLSNFISARGGFTRFSTSTASRKATSLVAISSLDALSSLITSIA